MSEEVSSVRPRDTLKIRRFDGEGESSHLYETSSDATQSKTTMWEEVPLLRRVESYLQHGTTPRAIQLNEKDCKELALEENILRVDEYLDEYMRHVRSLQEAGHLYIPDLQRYAAYASQELSVLSRMRRGIGKSFHGHGTNLGAIQLKTMTLDKQQEWQDYMNHEAKLRLEDSALQPEPELESQREWKAFISGIGGQRDAGFSSKDSSQHSFTWEEKALLIEEPLEEIAAQMIPELEPEPELEPKPIAEKILQVLHILSCKQLAELDPMKNALVPTRFYSLNIAFFDHDEESEVIHGPPIKGLPFSQFRTNVGLSNNVVSVKITKSDVGYPIRVFGTVLARDVVDYKCVYLFRRERDDAQLINSPRDELILTGPRRAFVTPDSLFFEIDLKIKGAPGVAEGDFSKGVMEHNTICYDDRAIARHLTSWRSTVEIVCTPVQYPVEATIEVKVLKGPRDVPFSTHVITWTDGYEDNPITLYEYDDSGEAGTRGSIGDDGSVALDRNLVAVPVSLPSTVDEDIQVVLDVVLMDSHGAEEFTHVALQYPCEEVVRRHGSYELQLKVTWRAVRYSPNHNRWLSMPLPLHTAHSWIWALIFHGSCGWS